MEGFTTGIAWDRGYRVIAENKSTLYFSDNSLQFCTKKSPVPFIVIPRKVE